MKVETRRQRTPLRSRTATDANGIKYVLTEWRDLVSVNANGRWSAPEPFNGHGEAMTFNDVELDRISSTQWALGQPPVVLTLVE